MDDLEYTGEPDPVQVGKWLDSLDEQQREQLRRQVLAVMDSHVLESHLATRLGLRPAQLVKRTGLSEVQVDDGLESLVRRGRATVSRSGAVRLTRQARGAVRHRERFGDRR